MNHIWIQAWLRGGCYANQNTNPPQKRHCCQVLGILILITVVFLTYGNAICRAKEVTKSLPELESLRTANVDEIFIATADLNAASAFLKEQEFSSGTKVFAQAGAAVINDSNADNRSNYDFTNIRAGLRFPLLGLATTEKRHIAQAQAQVREKEEIVAQTIQEISFLLRRSYIAYWAAQEKLILTQNFLTTESQQLKMLEPRRQAGFLLTSDALEFQTAFALARRQQTLFTEEKNANLRILQRLSSMHESFTALPPELPALPDITRETIMEASRNAPSVRLARARLAGLENEKTFLNKASPNANLDLYADLGHDGEDESTKYQLGFYIAVEAPWDTLFKTEHPRIPTFHARQSKLQREVRLEENRATTRLNEALGAWRTAQTNQEFARQRLQAATEKVRENDLRTALEGDTLEKLAQSHYARYQANLDYIDAQATVALRHATALEAGLGYVSQSKQQPVRSSGNADLTSVYVWNSKAVLDPTHASRALKKLHGLGVHRILLSLDRKQINELRHPSVRATFFTWIRMVQNQEILVELLLGEPTWILPQNRADLEFLITTLQDAPFDGLHLDIEPDQLDQNQITSDIMSQWLDTIRAAKNVSPWPLGVSMHPRYFQDPDRRLARALQALNV